MLRTRVMPVPVNGAVRACRSRPPARQAPYDERNPAPYGAGFLHVKETHQEPTRASGFSGSGMKARRPSATSRRARASWPRWASACSCKRSDRYFTAPEWQSFGRLYCQGSPWGRQEPGPIRLRPRPAAQTPGMRRKLTWRGGICACLPVRCLRTAQTTKARMY